MSCICRHPSGKCCSSNPSSPLRGPGGRRRATFLEVWGFAPDPKFWGGLLMTVSYVLLGQQYIMYSSAALNSGYLMYLFFSAYCISNVFYSNLYSSVCALVTIFENQYTTFPILRYYRKIITTSNTPSLS